MRGPQTCIEHSPSGRCGILFGGVYISLAKVGKLTGFSSAYLSYVFSGEISPSSTRMRKLAAALRMSTDDFYQALDDRKQRIANVALPR